MAAHKFLKNNAGQVAEESAVSTSAGAGDEGKLAALNASGVLDSTVVNSKVVSAGSEDAGKVVALDAAGKIDTTVLPTGIGADTQSMTASEAIASGDLVNIHNSTGAKVRKADATVAGKEAHGFVLVGGGSATSVTVYFEGSNAAVTGLTPGVQYLSTTAGLCSTTPPTGTGNVVQRVGFATAATCMNFQSAIPITLA